jgi:inner membrane protein YidH
MTMSPEENDNAPPSKPYVVVAACAMVYYAAERTLMTVVFTVLGIMALGFVLDRYGLAMSLLPHPSAMPGHHHGPYSLWDGSALVLAGSLIAVVAAIRYIALERRFQRECCGVTGHGLTLGVIFCLFVALIGVAISLILTTVRY